MQKENNSANNGAPITVDIQQQAISTVASGLLSGAEYWSLRVGGFGSANFQNAWDFATGKGILVGIIDEGVNYTHLDLVDNYSTDLDYDPRDAADALDAMPDETGHIHGTEVAGIISGSMNNTIGTIGAAPEATITASYVRFGSSVSIFELADAMSRQTGFDVSNNSWGFTAAFADNFQNAYFDVLADQLTAAAETGRGGLGTAVVFAAGNGKVNIGGQNQGDDSNFHNLQNSRYVISVGASDANGDAAVFSSPGTNVLISAPGVGLITTGGTEVGSTKSTYVSGTSFAAPLVSSAIALMLEVNPDLGYRDIQEILAITATTGRGAGAANGATNVNGGGMVFDRELGFGTLDAEAAVKLARYWNKQSTAANEQHIGADFALPSSFDGTSQSITVDIANPGVDGFSVDFVELSIEISDPLLKQLSIELISANGTHALIAPNLRAIGNKTYLDFTFSSVATWGENPFGTWTLVLSHPSPSDTFQILGAHLDVYGDATDNNDNYYFTASFERLAAADAARTLIVDTNGGDDTLNFAAAGAAVVIDLSGATASKLGATQLTFSGVFERVIGSVYGDTIAGTGLSETLIGDYGNDRLIGGGGGDILRGGHGNDVLIGGLGADLFDGGAGIDTGDFSATSGAVQIDLKTGMHGGDAAGDVFLSVERFLLGAQHDTFIASDDGTAFTVYGLAGDDLLVGGLANDVLDGGTGADFMAGGAGADTYYVDAREDFVAENAGEGIDTVYSTINYTLGANVEWLKLIGRAANGAGNSLDNRIDGNGYANVINGLSGADRMAGGGGNDIYYVDNARDTVVELAKAGIDTVRSTVSFKLAANVEHLTLLGRAANGDGNALANTIYGNASANVLKGNAGNDRLIGGAGNDKLYGGAGHDVMIGGAGADTFVFDTGLNRLTNVDRIVDFRHDVDRFHLDNAVFRKLGAAGWLKADFFVNGTVAEEANDHILYNRKSGALYYDADGSGGGKAVQFAILLNKPFLDAGDFLVI